MGPVDALSAALNQHLQHILNTAATSPPGGGPAWDDLMRYYGISVFDHQERQMIVQYMRLSRGATPAEVRSVLEGLRSWAFREMKQLRLNPAVDTSPEMGHMQKLVTEMVDRETTNYERMLGLVPPVAALPTAPVKPAGPSMGSIFANAQQTSKEVPWANMQYKQVATLTCVHCGGPQETPLDFMCKFCRRPIAGTTKKT